MEIKRVNKDFFMCFITFGVDVSADISIGLVMPSHNDWHKTGSILGSTYYFSIVCKWICISHGSNIILI